MINAVVASTSIDEANRCLQVDTVSQIFVSMSDSLADVEKKLARMQREHDS